MNKYLDFAEKLKDIIGADRVMQDEPMKNHTYFRLGGPADIMVSPGTVEELKQVLQLAKQEAIPTFVIGNGTNLLVRDGGIRGLVIKLADLNKIQVEGEYILADTGAQLKDISDAALAASLKGMEFSCGIPGSFGGAVFMNAGAYKGEMADTLEEVTVITPDGDIKVLHKNELELGYRTSAVKKHGHVVIGGKMKLVRADHQEIADKINRLTKMREDKQPLKEASAGSTFKRPEGHFAGQLIEECGFRGFELNGAAVSEKHCGFVINKNNATAKAVLDLISLIQRTVKDQKHVDLEPEVLIVGED